MTDVTAIPGSWHKDGFYGHYRSKARQDFLNEFRQLAKPSPPGKFIRRAKDPVRAHTFSMHDNKHSFPTDASSFGKGIGRRRFKERSFQFEPEFLQWMPHKKGHEGRGPSRASVYKVDYSDSLMPQFMIRRPKTSFDNDHCLSTTYRYAHGNDNPHKSTLDAMCNAAFTKPDSKPKKVRSYGRESVASCMSWYTPQPATSNYEVPSHYKCRHGNTPSSTQIFSAEAALSKKQEQLQSQSTVLSSKEASTVLSSDTSAAIATSLPPPAPEVVPTPPIAAPAAPTPAAVTLVPTVSAPPSLAQSKATAAES